MSWQPITDLPADWQALASSELQSLAKVWKEQAGRLRDSGAFKEYMARLQREIAIETGIIERLYTINRGVTRLLIERGIDEALISHGTTDKPVKQVVSLINDQETAIAGLFDFVGGQRNLSQSYILELHQVITKNQKTTEALNPQTGQLTSVRLRSGDWKRWPNNPMRADGSVYEYAPPEQVESEMEKLIRWHHEHQNLSVSPEVEAAWLHHRFTQIHPFQDGNGRVARLLSSLVFIRAGWFPLVLTRDDRVAYISALEEADKGDLSKLVDLFTSRQKRAFINSLSLSEQALADTQRTDAVISTVIDKLKRHKEEVQEPIRQSKDFANLLFEIAEKRLDTIATDIKLSVQNLVNDAQVFTVSAKADDERAWYQYQVIETAKQLEYYANIRSYHNWIQLIIDVERPTLILISFHVLGRENRGIFVCSACAYHRDESINGEINVTEIQPIVDAPFQFSYADQQENLINQYEKWLEKAIVTGLQYWNDSL